MSKSEVEINQLKEENKTLNTKFKELTDDELNIVTGGIFQNDDQTTIDSKDSPSGYQISERMR